MAEKQTNRFTDYLAKKMIEKRWKKSKKDSIIMKSNYSYMVLE